MKKDIVYVNTKAKEGSFTTKTAIKSIFDQHAYETITKQQIQRILEPVLRMIREGSIDRPRFQWYRFVIAPSLMLVCVLITILMVAMEMALCKWHLKQMYNYTGSRTICGANGRTRERWRIQKGGQIFFQKVVEKGSEIPPFFLQLVRGCNQSYQAIDYRPTIQRKRGYALHNNNTIIPPKQKNEKEPIICRA